MNQKQIFLSLTASFMAAMAEPEYTRDRIHRALGMAVEFAWDDHLDTEKAAFEYANWVINLGKPPAWLPQGFNHGYLG
jgi:hypothetical protein